MVPLRRVSIDWNMVLAALGRDMSLMRQSSASVSAHEIALRKQTKIFRDSSILEQFIDQLINANCIYGHESVRQILLRVQEQWPFNLNKYLIAEAVYIIYQQMSANNKNQSDSQNGVSFPLSLNSSKPVKRGRAIDQILEQLRTNSENYQLTQTSSIVLSRRQKQQEGRKLHRKQIYQQVLKPGDAVPRIFSSCGPLSTGDKYLDQKQKAKVLFSRRVFSREPNIVTGVFKGRAQTATQNQRKDWVNRKFSDYDEIVSEQTGPLRILLKKRKLLQNGITQKRPIYSGKLIGPANLFSSFESDKNNFYRDFKQTNSTNFCTIKCKTQTRYEGSQSKNSLSIGLHRLKKSNAGSEYQNKRKFYTQND